MEKKEISAYFSKHPGFRTEGIGEPTALRVGTGMIDGPRRNPIPVVLVAEVLALGVATEFNGELEIRKVVVADRVGVAEGVGIV